LAPTLFVLIAVLAVLAYGFNPGGPPNRDGDAREGGDPPPPNPISLFLAWVMSALLAVASTLAVSSLFFGWPAQVQAETIDEKVKNVKDSLVILCLAGGSETAISAKGDVDLRAKIKDILTGNIGAAAAGETKFSKKVWEGIIGGISNQMTAAQTQQASEARKCMVDNGFSLISRVLNGQ
jgi:hypothetical protein